MSKTEQQEAIVKEIKVDDGSIIKTDQEVYLKGRSIRKIKVTNITPNWVIFTDLTDGKRKDCTVDAFKKNASIEKPVIEEKPVKAEKPEKAEKTAKASKPSTADKSKLDDDSKEEKTESKSALREFALKGKHETFEQEDKKTAFTEKQFMILQVLAKETKSMSSGEIAVGYGMLLYKKTNVEEDKNKSAGDVLKTCNALAEKNFLVKDEKGKFSLKD